MKHTSDFKIAFLCSGLGFVKRGFESFTEDLFICLKDNYDIKVFKGGGQQGAHEKVLWCLKRNGIFYHLGFPRRILWLIEATTFTISFLPFFFKDQYNLIIVSHDDIGNLLILFKRLFHLQSKIVISNGGMIDIKKIRNIDYIFEVTGPQYNRTIKLINPTHVDKIRLLPYGIFTENFNIREDKAELRKKYNIPQSKYVVLSVGQINSHHKRIDFLINSFSGLDSNKYFLLMIGSSDKDTKGLKNLASQQLRNNFLFIEDLDYYKMPAIYKLSDCLVHCALFEAFGKIFLEAMASRLPIIAHNTELTQWIIDNNVCLIDMYDQFLLRDKIVEFSSNRVLVEEITKKNFLNVFNHFDWKVLREKYINEINKIIKF